MIFFIIGIALIGGGVGLWFYRKGQLDKALNIRYQETTTAKLIWENYDHIKDAVGTGNYTEIVEVKGVAVAKTPLIADHTEKPVVYYKATILREYETQERETDTNGNSRWVTRRHTETVSTNEQTIPFYIDDNSGKQIRVNMEGASKITQKSLDRFEREFSDSYLQQNKNTSWGGQLMNFLSSSNLGSSNTIGYRLVEECIPINAQLYVYGEASDRQGELAIVKPKEKGQNFIVSVKSEEELVEDTQSAAKWSLIGVIACVVLGIGSIIWGILK
ncbi:MAG: E3 ubiquitin ligase family protein [Raineya sp.]|jgi:hypothetical protein|nr:E3 ubiquitin ligase family protein [Raineya sp.]